MPFMARPLHREIDALQCRLLHGRIAHRPCTNRMNKLRPANQLGSPLPPPRCTSPPLHPSPPFSPWALQRTTPGHASPPAPLATPGSQACPNPVPAPHPAGQRVPPRGSIACQLLMRMAFAIACHCMQCPRPLVPSGPGNPWPPITRAVGHLAAGGRAHTKSTLWHGIVLLERHVTCACVHGNCWARP